MVSSSPLGRWPASVPVPWSFSTRTTRSCTPSWFRKLPANPTTSWFSPLSSYRANHATQSSLRVSRDPWHRVRRRWIEPGRANGRGSGQCAGGRHVLAVLYVETSRRERNESLGYLGHAPGGYAASERAWHETLSGERLLHPHDHFTVGNRHRR